MILLPQPPPHVQQHCRTHYKSLHAALATALLLRGCTTAHAWSWDVISSGAGSQQPIQRYGHSFLLWELPGTQEPEGILCGGASVLNDTLLSDCFILVPGDSWQWQRLTRGYFPRAGHTSTLYGDYLLLYGGNTTGCTGACATSPEVFKVGSWSHADNEQFLGTVPPGRMYHSGAYHATTNSWVIFGGVSLEDGTLLSDVAMLDMGDGTDPTYTWSTPSPAGSPPSPRHCHAAAMYGDVMIVVGGLDAGGSALNEVWTLTYSRVSMDWSWRQRGNPGGIPRYGHSLVLTDGDTLIMYGGSSGLVPGGGGPELFPAGGFRVLDLSVATWTWREPSVSGGWLQAPLWSAGIMLGLDSASNSQRMVVYGGRPDPAPTSAPTPDPSVYTNRIGVLSGINQDSAAAEVLLAALLGSGACVLFLIAILAYFGWRHHRHRATALSLEGVDQGASLGQALVQPQPQSSLLRFLRGSRSAKGGAPPPYQNDPRRKPGAGQGAPYGGKRGAGRQGLTPHAQQTLQWSNGVRVAGPTGAPTLFAPASNSPRAAPSAPYSVTAPLVSAAASAPVALTPLKSLAPPVVPGSIAADALGRSGPRGPAGWGAGAGAPGRGQASDDSGSVTTGAEDDDDDDDEEDDNAAKLVF